MSEPIEHGGELDEGQEGDGELVVAGGDAAVFFDAAEEVFNVMAVSVVAAMEPGRMTTTPPGGNATTGVLGAQALAEAKRVNPDNRRA